MNICFVGHFSGGGTERITFQLANELITYPNFTIYVINVGEEAPTFPLSNKITFINIKPAKLLKRIINLRRLLSLYQTDVLISIEALSGIYTIPATVGAHIKNIVWEHANYFQTQGSRWTRLIRKFWLRYADYYIVLTRRDLKNFQEHEKIGCSIDYI